MTTSAARLMRIAVLAVVLGLGLGTASAAQTTGKTTTQNAYVAAGATSTTCEVAGTTTDCVSTNLSVSVTSADEVSICVQIRRYGFIDYEYYTGVNEVACAVRDASIFELDKKIAGATLQPLELQLTVQCGDEGDDCQGPNSRVITIAANWTGVGDIAHRKANDKVESEGCTYQYHSKGFHREAVTSIVVNGATLTGGGGMFGSDDSMTIKCKQ